MALSVPALPCLAWTGIETRVCPIAAVKPSSHGLFSGTHSCSLAVRPRIPVMPVRANASLSELAPTAAAVYGSLLLGGGLFAYSRSSSKGSLLGGLSGGVLMGMVFLLSLNPQMKDLGEAIGFGTALLFVAVFGIRFAATKKAFPAAPLLLISIVASAVFVGAYLQDRV
ncbi:hypothetical protein L7F22_007718 [Adiantum nelumboides]|nr:hypothetical protein [Adiantum nelumboides]